MDNAAAPLGNKFPLSHQTLIWAASGCVAFMVAKSIVSNGRLSGAQLEYWLLGAVPFFVLNFYAAAICRVFGRNSTETEIQNVQTHFFGAWLFALIAFVFLRVTFFADYFQLPLYRLLEFGHMSFAKALLALLYVCLGAIVLTLIASLQRNPRPRLPVMVGLTALNWLMFYALVYALPVA